MEAINTIKEGKYLLEIYPDNNPSDPRGNDNLGTMICFHSRYKLGDKHEYNHNHYNGWDEMKEAIIKKEKVHTILPLFLYDHSGITMSTSSFNDRWDSGQVGFIFISKAKVKKEKIDESKVGEYLKGEVETYDQYLTGDVYGYKLFEVSTCNKGCEHKEELESCCGYYGQESCEEDGKSMLKTYTEEKVVS